MRLKLWSDLHLEFPRSTVPINQDGADLLILAGDICLASEISDAAPFFEKCAATFPSIIYIAGNHEYYSGSWERAYDQIREALAPHKNIHVLDGEPITIQETPFWAGTMWTDFDNSIGVMRDAAHGMNDYRVIHTITGPLHPEDTLARHRAQREALAAWIPTVPQCAIITHHAPSKRSLHPRYTGSSVNAAYSSDLTALMAPNVRLWCHGHTHDSFDYQEGTTRIVANPAGYPINSHGDRENKKFNPSLVIDL